MWVSKSGCGVAVEVFVGRGKWMWVMLCVVWAMLSNLASVCCDCRMGVCTMHCALYCDAGESRREGYEGYKQTRNTHTAVLVQCRVCML